MLLPKLAAIYLSLTLSGVRALECSQEIGSDFLSVDAGGGQAFAIRTGDLVYRWCNYRWIPVMGTMKQISVNGSTVYGIHNTWHLYRYLHGSWFLMDETTIQITAKHTNMLYAIGELLGNIFCSLLDKNDPTYSSWKPSFITMSVMACGLHDCWGIDSNGNLRYLITPSTCAVQLSFIKIYGNFVTLDVSDNGVVYAIDSNWKLHRSIGVRTSVTTLEPLLPEKKIRSVSVDGDLLWLVTVEGTIMLCNV
uniref:fish-egg lectin-like n=1 Tax=Myxine glutinosa TaxID=7769 RepID=UPI00358ED356